MEMLHFWNHWSSGQANESYALSYMVNNATAIYSKRNDNCDLFDVFGIFYRHGLRIGNWAGGGAGTTGRMRGFGVGFDACGSGLTIDSDANGSQLDLYGFYAHGHDTTITSGHLIDIQGTNGTARIFGKSDLSNAHRSALNVVGAGAACQIDNPIITTYNMANGGYTAVNAAAGTYGAILRGEIGISGGSDLRQDQAQLCANNHLVHRCDHQHFD
jgi:hypothetical protein